MKNEEVPILKDADQQQHVPSVWRTRIASIVDAVVEATSSPRLGTGSACVLGAHAVDQIREYVSQYGERLDRLSEDTWLTSVTQWMGQYWDVLVDLWTVESGRSDLVLALRVREAGDDYRFEVLGVYVP